MVLIYGFAIFWLAPLAYTTLTGYDNAYLGLHRRASRVPVLSLWKAVVVFMEYGIDGLDLIIPHEMTRTSRCTVNLWHQPQGMRCYSVGSDGWTPVPLRDGDEIWVL